MKLRICMVMIAVLLCMAVNALSAPGQVLRRNGRFLLVESDTGLGRKGDIVEIYRYVEGRQEYVGAMRIVTFRDGMTAAEVVDERQDRPIAAGDHVRGFGQNGKAIEERNSGRHNNDADNRAPSVTMRETVGLYEKIYYGPLAGYTAIPSRRRFMAAADLELLSASTGYTPDGKLYDYSDLSKYYIYSMTLRGMYGITGRITGNMLLPVYLRQSEVFSQAGASGDKAGLTGIGDLSLGIQALYVDGYATRGVVGARLKLATGSSEDDMKADNLNPTGTGAIAIALGTAIDFYQEKTLFSAALHWQYNHEARLGEGNTLYRKKPGNELRVETQIIYLATEAVGFGVALSYSQTGETQLGSVPQPDTNSAMFNVTPLFGFRTGTIRHPIDLKAAYLLPVSGRSTFRFVGLVISGSYYF